MRKDLFPHNIRFLNKLPIFYAFGNLVMINDLCIHCSLDLSHHKKPLINDEAFIIDLFTFTASSHLQWFSSACLSIIGNRSSNQTGNFSLYKRAHLRASPTGKLIFIPRIGRRFPWPTTNRHLLALSRHQFEKILSLSAKSYPK